MEKFFKDKKTVEVPIVLCNVCKDKENTPYIYPSRQKDEYLVFCPRCGSYEFVSGRELGVNSVNGE
jgi:Zn finger protein HypA/HybF involved in hydrogenase expression